MRAALALVGCFCLALSGCRTAAAEDEVVVRQRTTSALPGLGGDIKVRVGDIQRGKSADVDIIGPGSASLAKKSGAQVGDRIPFSHDGKQYQLEVVHYFDDIGSGDSAKFRLIQLSDS